MTMVLEFYFDAVLGMDENQNAISNGPTSTTYPFNTASFSYTNGVDFPTSEHKLLLTDKQNSVKENGAPDESSASFTASGTTRVNPLLLLDAEVTLPGAVNVGNDTGAKEKSPPPQPQRQPNAHHNRQRTHSGSYWDKWIFK